MTVYHIGIRDVIPTDSPVAAACGKKNVDGSHAAVSGLRHVAPILRFADDYGAKESDDDDHNEPRYILW